MVLLLLNITEKYKLLNLRTIKYMKYIKKYEKIDWEPIEIGDYVQVNDDTLNSFNFIYNITDPIFKIKSKDSSKNKYYLETNINWKEYDDLDPEKADYQFGKNYVRRNQITKLTPEQVEEYYMRKNAEKYNIT